MFIPLWAFHIHTHAEFVGSSLIPVLLSQDNTEILGYVLGLLSFIISSSSRIPELYRAVVSPREEPPPAVTPPTFGVNTCLFSPSSLSLGRKRVVVLSSL